MTTSVWTSFKMFYKFLLIVSVFQIAYSLPVVDNIEASYRTNYKYMKDLNFFLKKSVIKKNWHEAVVECEYEDGELFVPLSKIEAASVIKFDGRNSLWIGIHDIYAEGEFVTINGTSINDIYSNWNLNEPNNAHNNESCVLLYIDGKYNDLNCEVAQHFVCKKSIESFKEWNAPCDTYDMNYIHVEDLNVCYKYHTIPMNWHNAYRTCKGEKANLALINSEKEAQFLVKMVESEDENAMFTYDTSLIHLGFSDLLYNGIFVTIDGVRLTKSGYMNWAPGQPEASKNIGHCGSMLKNGQLNNENCQNVALFICEKTPTIIMPIQDIQ